jgi:hypothetical protein
MQRRSLLTIVSLLGVVSCSSGGGSGVADGGSIAPAVPAQVAIVATAAPDSIVVTSGALPAAASAAELAGQVGIDATELASLAVPATSDVAAVGDAVEPFAWGATLNGSYHGLINNRYDGYVQQGGTTFDLERSGSSFTGSGTARSGQYVVDVSISGTVIAEYPHSVAVSISLTSSAASQTGGVGGCTYTGSGRRYRHVLVAGLGGPGTCGTVYLKVHPVASQ